jgi:peptidoglycan/xylan/chitin deacetylase (PgdA/CDA1 family)
VALTFDDGPGPSTPAILGILRSFGVRATFFNIGLSETRWPQDVEAEAAGGFLVADHTWDHPPLTTLSSADQAAEIDQVAAEQRKLVGSSPCELRPPYGVYNQTTLELASVRHLAVWMWSVDTEDWQAEGSGSPYWVDRIISLAESEGGGLEHPVVLMHNQSIPMPATVAALPTIIRYFESRHYVFVDLLGRTGPPGTCGSSAPFGRSPSTDLQPGASLQSGASMASPGGQFTLTETSQGPLVLATAGGRRLWSTPGAGRPGSTTTMGSDGDLVVAAPDGERIWSTATGGHPGAFLALGEDGDVTVENATSALWSARSGQDTLFAGERLHPGWSLYSPDRACRLVMEPSGSLVLQSASYGVLWSSVGVRAADSSAELLGDGNLVVFARSGKVTWSAGVHGTAGTHLEVTDAAQSVLLESRGRWIWSSG